MKPRQIVDEMDSYVPGRSQDEIAQEFNLNKDEIIKLGSNENPWGPSPKAMEWTGPSAAGRGRLQTSFLRQPACRSRQNRYPCIVLTAKCCMIR